jgi:ammonia channel protein AmtB
MAGARRIAVTLLLCGLALLCAPLAFAQSTAPAPAPASAPATPAPPAPKIDSGDTAWVRVSSARVLLMTAPGLALFYGGMVRQKNALGTLMQSFIILALISVQWVLWGYSLAFGPDKGGVIGGLEWVGLSGVGAAPNADYAATIPHTAFMLFQMMFAVITPALITGAFAERKKFSTFLVFILLWATVVYDPLAHWVWGGGGWLRNLGALDFAGGTVVHISSGISALAAALVIGKRRGYGHQPMPPHNLPFTVLGASLLWFGWFGFNAGSALATGLFATKLVNDAGGDGLFYGNPKQLWVQIVAVLVTWVLGFVMTTIILKVLDAVMGLRVTDEEEVVGLDLSQHSETAYMLGGTSGYGEARAGH